MDMQTAFLNGYLDEEVYLQHPRVLLSRARKIKFVNSIEPFTVLGRAHGLGTPALTNVFAAKECDAPLRTQMSTIDTIVEAL